MGITFNRAPISVDTPSSSQVKNYFFNHYEWKGLNDDKNFLSVDQHTFADCNNVYIDSEGLLKSRPSLKVKKITVNINGTFTLGDILDCWTFENVTVYKTYSDETKYYYLTFVNKNYDEAKQLPLTYVENEETKTYGEIKLIVADEKIFVFSEYAFEYYDVKDNIVGNAEKFIHIPVTSVIVNGITTSSSKVESKNILTDAYITKYLYSNVNNTSLSKFIGKTVTVTIDDDSYEITFEKNSQVTFVKKYVELTESNFAPSIHKQNSLSPDSILGVLSRDKSAEPLIYKYPLYFSSSKKESSIFCECNVAYVDNVETEKSDVISVSWTIYHTTDGLTYTRLPNIDGILGTPKISYDGNYCIVFLKDGPYIHSLVQTEEGGYKYSYWKNLTESQGLYLNPAGSRESLFSNSTLINGYFHSDTDFVFVYGSNVIENWQYPDVTFGRQIGVPTATPDIISCTYNNHYKIFTSIKIVCCIGGIISIKDVSLPKPGGNSQYMYFYDSMPTVYMRLGNDDNATKILIDCECILLAPHEQGENDANTQVIYTWSVPNVGHTYFTLSNNELKTYNFYDEESGITQFYIDNRTPLENSMYIDDSFTASFVTWKSDNSKANRIIAICEFVEKIPNTETYKTVLKDVCLYKEDYNVNKNELVISPLRFNINNGYLLSTSGMIVNNNYTDLSTTEDGIFVPVPLLFNAQPVETYENGYVVLKDNYLYRTLYDGDVFTIDELTEGKTKYFLPSKDALLSNYYFSDSNILYISSPAVNVNVNDDGTISENKIDFEWYLPEINKQEFDYTITNLHPISNTEVAVFFEHSISYVTWDSDVNAYRYYKSKVQAGCKPGCDVLTTFDGKYVMFTSARGLVALTSQEFMATTEQTINYLSDTIFSAYDEYISDTSLSNGVKLFKHAFWIIAYKPLSKKLFVYDVRNSSWWPITCPENVQKIIVYNDKPEVLIVNTIMTLDKSELNYYDYDSEENKISWFIRSQKLYLDALNYYKHIVNMTFTSSHDKQLLDDANYDTSSISFKLQVNNYRKKVDGYIGDDEYTFVNYTVEAARTYVLRLNYSKVNEFEYLLSSDEENAISIPLSLNSITIKYKIGSQVR